MIAGLQAVILTLACLVCLFMRRASAATRHMIWLLAFSATLAIAVLYPIAGPYLPRFNLPSRIGTPTVEITTGPGLYGQVPAKIAPGFKASDWLHTIWLAGSGVMVLRMAFGLAVCIRRRKMARPAHFPIATEIFQTLGLRRKIEIRQLDAPVMPETFGFVRPVILVPTEASVWPEAALRITLTHELTHISRNDWLALVIARAAACLMWFNPLCWYALSRMQKDRELACDDRVLGYGIRASEYASQLLDIVRLFRRPICPSPAFVVAGGSPLETRIRAMLNPNLNRRSPSMTTKLFAINSAVIITLLLCSFNATGQGNSRLSGVVRDASGGVVPEAVVLVSNSATKINETVRTNAAGEYDFSSLPAGRYAVKVLKPGFQAFSRTDVAVATGSAVQVDANLELGRISEMMQVVAQGQPRSQRVGDPAASGAPKRIRVGGSVHAAKLIKQVRPAYPAHLASQGIEGTVMLEAVIGSSGSVMSVAALNSQVHPDFVRAATEAVSQWVYSSTLLNGLPVEVITSVTIDFKLVQ